MRGLVILLAFVAITAAKRNWRVRNPGLRCKYNKGDWSSCDNLTNTVTRVLSLRNGEDGCQQTVNQTISCEKYEHIQSWKATKIERKRERHEHKLLRKENKKEEKLQMKENRKLMKEQRKRCEYEYSDWSGCNSTTNTVSRVLTLKGAQEGCQTEQTITITCHKYNRIQTWKAKKSERRNRKIVLKQQKKEMKEKRKMVKEQRMMCKYDRDNWSDCDNTTNTVTRVLTLRDGEKGCEPTLDFTITCRRYERIQAWKVKKMEMKKEKKEGKLQMKEEKNQLKENKRVVKQMRKDGCSFEVSFSECDPSSQMATKTYTPIPQGDDSCEAKSITYSCQLHARLMEKKMRRQEKKGDRKILRKEFRRQWRNNKQQ